jgi:hypothetical protein
MNNFARCGAAAVLMQLSLSWFLCASETVSVSFQTTASGGRWSPAHVVAVWMETSDGVFVRTIGNWSRRRRYELDNWLSKAGNSDGDAVMGATLTNHSSLLVLEHDKAWNMVPRNGTVPVADGRYVLHIEKDDGTEYRTQVAFEKNGQPSLIGPLTQSGFRNLVLYYSGRSAVAADTFVIASGNNQTGVPQQPLASPLTVLMKDAVHNPAVGVEVLFRVVIGDGTISAAQSTTNAQGIASVSWTLGSSLGTQQLVATAAGFPALFFRARAGDAIIAEPTSTAPAEPKSCGYGTGLSALLLLAMAKLTSVWFLNRQRFSHHRHLAQQK